METTQLKASFDQACEEYHSDYFAKLANKRSQRQDLHAFLLLEELQPSKIHMLGYGHDMVSAAEHDQIWLDVDLDSLAAVITHEQIMELAACGVFLSSDTDSLSMYV